MSVGTKSVLFGAHAFWLHPWFVAWAWWKLYGFPWQPWLWVAFFVHDLGYWGKPNMDGPEGEEHPKLGASILYRVQVWWGFLQQPVFYRKHMKHRKDVRWWQLQRRLLQEWTGANVAWGKMVLYHSRFLSKKNGVQPSRLCIADKLAICLTPWWLYLPMARATGEIHEYMALAEATNDGLVHGNDQKRWFLGVQKYVREWVEEHKDGREDTWTPDERQSRDENGVWS